MRYIIKTMDGYTFQFEATEDDCIDVINWDDADITFANESELQTWIAENIENICELLRAHTDNNGNIIPGYLAI